MNYFILYNPAGRDTKLFYPLFHCERYTDTHYKTLAQAKSKLKAFPDGLIVECDWDTPKVYKEITTGKTWKYNGSKWISSK